jgi:hypothetical protein
VGEENKCIVFVHGIDMTIAEIKSYSASFYKRLWWQGYRGRLAVFQWATPLDSEMVSWESGLTIFNDGEFRSWTDGWSLKQYVASLSEAGQMPGATISIAGHSLGNACVGAALKQGMVVDNYAMMEAAVALSAYSPPPSDPSNDPLATSNLSRMANAEANQATPDYHTDQGYRGYLKDISQNVRNNWANYSNPSDFWLETGFTGIFTAPILVGGQVVGVATIQPVEVNWVKNQAELKIQSLVAASSYIYNKSEPEGARAFFVSNDLTGNSFSRTIGDTHETLAYVARARTTPVGAEPGTRNGKPPNAASSLDLRAYGFDRNRNDHSGQFQRDIQLMYSSADGTTTYRTPFFTQLMTDLNVNPAVQPQ